MAVAVVACLALFCFALVLIARRVGARNRQSSRPAVVMPVPSSGLSVADASSIARRSASSSSFSLVVPKNHPPRFDAESILAFPPSREDPKNSILKLGPSGLSAKTDRLNIEGGMLEVSWGAADSLGPLDVVNPRDYSDQTDPDFLSRKIAQPMLYGSYAIDHASRVEAVFVPESTAEQFSSGFRFTTSIGASDVGLQFYYGSLPKAGAAAASPANPNEVPVRAANNRYSQLGADLSSTIGATTVRGEIAADITDDLSGTDGSVCNPSILWSLGSERVLSGGLELNAQCSGSVRLMNDKVGTEKNDIESETSPSDTTLALRLSRKFLEDRLAVSATTLYGIESSACLVKSAIAWGPASRRIEISGGVYSGSPASSLVRFLDHDYVKLTMSCDY